MASATLALRQGSLVPQMTAGLGIASKTRKWLRRGSRERRPSGANLSNHIQDAARPAVSCFVRNSRRQRLCPARSWTRTTPDATWRTRI